MSHWEGSTPWDDEDDWIAEDEDELKTDEVEDIEPPEAYEPDDVEIDAAEDRFFNHLQGVKS